MYMLNPSHVLTRHLLRLIRFVYFTSNLNTFGHDRLKFLVLLWVKLVFPERISKVIWHRRSTLLRFPHLGASRFRFDATRDVFFICWNHSYPFIFSLNLAPSWSYSKLLSIDWSIDGLMNGSLVWRTLGMGHFFFLDGVVYWECSSVHGNRILRFLLDQVFVYAVDVDILR